jgi:superoxide reductase
LPVEYLKKEVIVAEKLELYRCNVCKMMIEVVLGGEGSLTCCNEPMVQLIANTVDASAEKHVPVVEIVGDEKIIRVGSTPHPMEEAHYIQFIEIISEAQNYVKRKYLHPHEKPEMELKCCCSDAFAAREHCNLHGLWANT